MQEAGWLQGACLELLQVHPAPPGAANPHRWGSKPWAKAEDINWDAQNDRSKKNTTAKCEKTSKKLLDCPQPEVPPGSIPSEQDGTQGHLPTSDGQGGRSTRKAKAPCWALTWAVFPAEITAVEEGPAVLEETKYLWEQCGMNHITHGPRAPGNGSWHFENNVMNLLRMRLGRGTIISKPVSHGRLRRAKP